MAGNSYPSHNQHAYFQSPVAYLEDRIRVLEGQLSHVQKEKDTMQTVIKYLLEDLSVSKKSMGSSSVTAVLKYRLSLMVQANHCLKTKLRKMRRSILTQGHRLSCGCSIAKTPSTAQPCHSPPEIHDVVRTDCPDVDLLGGTIPVSIVEQFPAASSFNTDQSLPDSPPDLGDSDDEQTSGSETESLSFPTSAGPFQLPRVYNQAEAYKTLVPSVVLADNLTTNAGTSGTSTDFSASQGPPRYVRYFSTANAQLERKGQEVIESSKTTGSDGKHFDTLTGFAGVASGPVFVKAGPYIFRPLSDDQIPLVDPTQSTRLTSSSTPSSSSLEHKSSQPPTPGSASRPSSGSSHGCNVEVFATSAERENAIAANRKSAGPQDVIFPDIFRYGIRYNPNPNEQNVYRTVLVEGLPYTITFESLLKKVRGGSIVSVKLCDTLSITGSCTALITFLRESAASAYEDFAASHPLSFGGKVAKVSMLQTPTWPMTIKLKIAIFDHHHTRCLEVTSFPRHIQPSTLRLDLRICSAMDCDLIEFLAMRDDGVLDIRFASINAAGQAYGILTSYRRYRQCSVRFSPDPCVLPPDSILDESVSTDDVIEGGTGLEDDDVHADQFADDEWVGEEDIYAEDVAEDNEANGVERVDESFAE
ncbi:hypothetical protein MMC16_007820 [Acarospora aff. strigata]|nr:hypothetical protein [Acarospora aff. strigata]